MSKSIFHEYGVRVIQRDFEPYEESFREFGTDSAAAINFYRNCGNVKETCGIVSTVTAERKNDDGEWEVVFKREINGWL